MSYCRAVSIALLVVCLAWGEAACSAVRRVDADAAFHNNSRYSGKQILRMGLDKFLTAYTHGTRQWQWEEKAYPIYVHYKARDNTRRIAHCHHNSRRQMKRFYAELGTWEADAFQLRYDYYSHGTALPFARLPNTRSSWGRLSTV